MANCLDECLSYWGLTYCCEVGKLLFLEISQEFELTETPLGPNISKRCPFSVEVKTVMFVCGGIYLWEVSVESLYVKPLLTVLITTTPYCKKKCHILC